MSELQKIADSTLARAKCYKQLADDAELANFVKGIENFALKAGIVIGVIAGGAIGFFAGH